MSLPPQSYKWSSQDSYHPHPPFLSHVFSPPTLQTFAPSEPFPKHIFLFQTHTLTSLMNTHKLIVVLVQWLIQHIKISSVYRNKHWSEEHKTAHCFTMENQKALAKTGLFLELMLFFHSNAFFLVLDATISTSSFHHSFPPPWFELPRPAVIAPAWLPLAQNLPLSHQHKHTHYSSFRHTDIAMAASHVNGSFNCSIELTNLQFV